MTLQITVPENAPGLLAIQQEMAEAEEALLAATRKWASLIVLAGEIQPTLVIPPGVHGYPNPNDPDAWNKTPRKLDPNAMTPRGVPLQWETKVPTKIHPFHRNEMMAKIGKVIGALADASAYSVEAHTAMNENGYELSLISGGGGK